MAEIPLPTLLVSKEEAHQRIQKQIEEGQQLHDRQIYSDDELLYDAVLEADNWSDYNADLLLRLFGESELTGRYINRAYNQYSYSFTDYEIKNLEYEVKEHKRSILITINSLKGIQKRLELYTELLDVQWASTTEDEETSDNSACTFGDKVFIVHGHDDGTKETIARFVENLGIETTILHEQANRGQTIPEKFEEHAAEAGFAIILLTPDDVGAPKNEEDNLKPRARQNVLVELGYFWSRLGRERVCVLHKEEVELPSDMQGLLYVPMDSYGAWREQLRKEMQQAGLPVNLENLLQNR